MEPSSDSRPPGEASIPHQAISSARPNGEQIEKFVSRLIMAVVTFLAVFGAVLSYLSYTKKDDAVKYAQRMVNLSDVSPSKPFKSVVRVSELGGTKIIGAWYTMYNMDNETSLDVMVDGESVFLNNARSAPEFRVIVHILYK